MKIILGVDPGSKITGYGFLELYKNEINYLFSGYIFLKDKNFFKRLNIIYKEMKLIIKKYNPNYFAIEKIFVGKNMDSAIKLSHARSAAILALNNFNIPIYEYTFSQVKKCLLKIDNNNTNIKNIILNRLKINNNNFKEDVFDALAIAITNFYDIKNFI
ncbi:crossover junction endodeoxyribonuclease RuvC [endosymbiont of Pachyrhynchus infernalis]|uniref:crossover junction endodeoxyribonuclease RuvC n=1 Tax=endosymbiont of Pachyrhynchus infernalis TaxID=1971488 RepID=UPI000DC72436|nr:crossover junction endodeoxyribonuclease RuvC [endosymbiont of Pachyrhynchus infernalis]BBA84788.1 crossover junction endodeoxyribonuclease RuvC [endosymbiont of Pachyrhynchus infernalis]